MLQSVFEGAEHTQFRVEVRYLLDFAKLPELQVLLKRFAIEKTFPENRNETIYFNTFDYRLPFEISLRARRYTNNPQFATFILNNSGKWKFEQKIESPENPGQKLKVQRTMALSEILRLLREETGPDGALLSPPIVPLFANNYKRHNYFFKDSENIRITVDYGTSYYALSAYGGRAAAADRIGWENFIRIELKDKDGVNGNTKLDELRDGLLKLGAVQVISKKDSAANLYGLYLKSKVGYQKEASNIEMEAKLSLSCNQQHLFHTVMEDFADGKIEGFGLSKRFQHVAFGGQFNTYLSTSDGFVRMEDNSLKTIYTKKGAGEILEDSYGLRCITKRSEILVDKPKAADPEGLVTRKKFKSFIVANEKGEEYTISIDRSTSNGSSIYQIEIERTLMSPSKEDEQRAMEDIARMVKAITAMHSELEPTTETKYEFARDLTK